MTETIELKDAARYFDSLGQGIKEAAVRGLVSAANKGLQKILTQIIPSRSPVPSDRGVYRAGWKVDPSEPKDGATLYNDEPHAVFIEDGVRPGNVKPGRAMIQNLAEWALRKGFADDEFDAEEIAWGIYHSARRRGFFEMSGLGILRELVDQHLPGIIRQEVSKEIEQEKKRRH